jgi:hypothetical protein
MRIDDAGRGFIRKLHCFEVTQLELPDRLDKERNDRRLTGDVNERGMAA